MNEDDSIKACLTYPFLKKSCYWIVYKYNIDDLHIQQNSSRGDLIGGFIDRWINRIPETLIFNQLLEDNMKDEGITVVNDIFLYKDSESKSAPDILGLRKDEKIYPFVKFNNGFWDSQGVDFPFVEMKTFRENQSLITIPKNQFYLDHYYTIVESHIHENYLLSLFSRDFFSEDFSSNYKELIKHFKISDDYNQLIIPDRNIEKNKDLGYYELLGIYKGNILNEFSITAGKTGEKIDKPRYLKKIEEYEYGDEIIQSSVVYEYFSEKRSIPIFFKIPDDSKIRIVNIDDDEITIKVEGDVEINGKSFSSGNYDLVFKTIIYNSIKFYILDDIVNTSSPTIEKDILISSGLYFHNPEDRVFVKIDIKIIEENSKVQLIKKNQSDIYFAVDGKISVDGHDLETGVHKIQLGYKTNVIKIYHLKDSSGSSILNNKNPTSVVETVPLPFTHKYELKEEKYTYEPINIDMDKNSKMVFIKTKKDNFTMYIKGLVKLNGEQLDDGCFYEVKFDGENNFYKIVSKHISKIENPLFDTNSSQINIQLKTGLYKHYENEDEKNVPIFIKIDKGSDLSIVKKTKTYMIVQIEGKAVIDGYPIHNKNNEGYWILLFDTFNRSSEKEEIILSKRAIASSKESSQEELLIEFEKFIESFNK